jgi:recombination protein RecT
MSETVTGAAIAKRETGPGAMIKQYSSDFTTVLPSHLNGATWVRLAQGALKKGKKTPNGRTELETAAANNPGAFLAALLDAARLGLEPGTEQYYLVPQKIKGQPEIRGIVGWQGYVELMYRAGAISSVVAECVYTADKFAYQPGIDERPRHEIDWDAPNRGDLRLVYSYAVMGDGATSKVVVLNRAAIDRIKASSQGADSPYSPWVTHEPAMWLKSAVRQLAKWVPTSAEYRKAVNGAADNIEQVGEHVARHMPPYPADDTPVDVSNLSEMRDDDPDLLDAEIVDDDTKK